MKSVSCFLFIFFTTAYNVRRILSQPHFAYHAIELTRHDHRLDNAYPNETWDFKLSEDNDNHVATVGFGYPQQSGFRVQFSTSHSRSWVFSGRYDGYTGRCSPDYKITQRLHKLYAMKNSSSYHADDKRAGAFMRYEDDWAFGYKSKDIITIISTPSIETLTHEFIEIVQSTERFTHGKPDGVISLRYKVDRAHEHFVSRLCGDHSQFSFFFPRNTKDRTHTTTGQLLLCGIDEDKYVSGSMLYVNDTTPGQWRIDVQRVTATMKNGTVYRVTDDPDKAIFDSTTDRIFGPAQFIDRMIYSLINKGTGFVGLIQDYPYRYWIECDKRDDAPTLNFIIGGVTWQIDAYGYTRKIDYPDRAYCEILLKKTINGVVGHDIDYWILGDIFLRSMYTVFDIRNRRIGISKAHYPGPNN